MSKKALITGICLTSCLVPTQVFGATFSDLYVFGDSLVDDGNFFEQTKTVTPNPLPPFPGPPYPNSPYFQGRFSNGPVWVELLPEKLGFTYNPDNNFASGGAGAGTFHQAGSAFPGLETQIDGYLAQGSTADANALYVISAGSNDYNNPTSLEDVRIPVQNITDSVTRLYTAGARKFMIVGIPNLSEVPGNRNAPPPIRDFLSALSGAHNSVLTQSLQTLSGNLDVDIFQLDIASLYSEATNDPERFGFTNVTEGCFNLFTFERCSNPDDYLFWDAAHPTAVSHRAIANFAHEQLDDPHPIPESSSVFGVLLLGALGIGYWVRDKHKNGSAEAAAKKKLIFKW